MDEQPDPDADLTADKHNLSDTFPSINRFARDVGLPAERMAAAFALEREFHRAVLSEPSPERRRELYNDIYTRVFAIYGFEFKVPVDPGPSPRDALVRLLMPELRGRAILDVGCGGANSCSPARGSPSPRALSASTSSHSPPRSRNGA